MNEAISIIGSILLIFVLIGSLVFLIYNVFNNTPYPNEEKNEEPKQENLVDVESVEAVPITDPKDLTQLTLKSMQDNMTELPGGYLLPPPLTKFQCFLPPLRQ